MSWSTAMSQDPQNVTGLESVTLSRKTNMFMPPMTNPFSGQTSDQAFPSATTPETVFFTLVTDHILSRSEAMLLKA